MNLVIVRGVVTTEPVVLETPEGRKILKFRLVTSNGIDTRTGLRRRGDLHQIVKWQDKSGDDGKILQLSHQISKGSKVTVIGKITYNRWISKSDGTERFKTEIIARQIDFFTFDVDSSEPDSDGAGSGELDPVESLAG